MKVGILGTGFGAYHAELYKGNRQVEAVRIWGRSGEKCATLATRMGLEAASDAREILEDRAIGLVDICLPNGLHREYAIKALECGKDVFIETPLCSTREDAGAVLAAARAHGQRVFVNQFIKFFPEYRYIKDAADSGRFGRLLSLHAWRKTPAIWGALGFEALPVNLMIHELDFVTWLLGRPGALTAGGVQKNDRECCVDASLAYDGASALVTASSMLPAGYPFSAGFSACFEEAAVEFAGEFPDGPPIKRATLYMADGRQELQPAQVNPYEAALAHVVACCREGCPTVLDAADAALSLGLALDIREAVRG